MLSCKIHSQYTHRAFLRSTRRSFTHTNNVSSRHWKLSNHNAKPTTPLPGARRTEPPHLSPANAAPLIHTLRSRSHETVESISYIKPLVFGGLACAQGFVVAAWVYDRNQETVWQRWKARWQQQQQRLLTESWSDNYFSSWWSRRSAKGKNDDFEVLVDDQGHPVVGPTMRELWIAKREMLTERRQEWMDRFRDRLQQWQQVYGLPEPVRRLGLMVATKYATMSESERTMAGLVGLNVLVFGAWQIPRLAPFMSRWFMHHPGSGRSITLITSCFSHKDFLHLTFNMVGLWSFGGLMHSYLGREQFLALYLSTGIGANMVSHTFNLALRKQRGLLPSLGASGAIYGLLAGTAYLEPEANVSLIFFPFFSIPLKAAVPALMGVDMAGIILKWKMFDHYAHLAGAAIGLSYMSYDQGEQYIWRPLVQTLHDIRHSS